MAYWYLGGGNLNVGDKIVDLLDRNGTLAAQARARAMSSVPSAAGPRPSAFSQIDPDATVRAATMRTNAQEADYTAKLREEMARRQLAEDARQFDVGQSNKMSLSRNEAQARAAAMAQDQARWQSEQGRQDALAYSTIKDREADNKTRADQDAERKKVQDISKLNGLIDNVRSQLAVAPTMEEKVALQGQLRALMRQQALLMDVGSPQAQAVPVAAEAAPAAPTASTAPASGEPLEYTAPDGTQAAMQSMPMAAQSLTQQAEPTGLDGARPQPPPPLPAHLASNPDALALHRIEAEKYRNELEGWQRQKAIEEARKQAEDDRREAKERQAEQDKLKQQAKVVDEYEKQTRKRVSFKDYRSRVESDKRLDDTQREDVLALHPTYNESMQDIMMTRDKPPEEAVAILNEKMQILSPPQVPVFENEADAKKGLTTDKKARAALERAGVNPDEYLEELRQEAMRRSAEIKNKGRPEGWNPEERTAAMAADRLAKFAAGKQPARLNLAGPDRRAGRKALESMAQQPDAMGREAQARLEAMRRDAMANPDFSFGAGLLR